MTINEVANKFGITQDTLRYYEKVGAIPSVGRTNGGIRNYQEEDLKWIQTALCLRDAGVSIESIVEYVRLSKEDSDNFEARRGLLHHERNLLIGQKQKLEQALTLLDYKISRYDRAIKTGVLSWDEEG